jgi:hypothetical protein
MAEKDRSKEYAKGHLFLIDKIPWGDPRAGSALSIYTNSVNGSRQSRHWVRSVQWMENVLFGLGRHYIDDILVSRLSKDSSGSQSVAREIQRSVPKPTNDLLGRYIETNIALLTENRPRPRITPKGDAHEDKVNAELSELTIEYLWEELKLPELHREMARLILYTGVCFLEVLYDPFIPRHMMVPDTETEPQTTVPGPEGAPLSVPIERQVPAIDAQGRPKLTMSMEFGDVTAKVISPFEIHLPTEHWYHGEEMQWIMREYYAPIDHLRDKYGDKRLKKVATKRNGWFLNNIDKINPSNVQNLPLWWWERLTDVVEGPGPTLYVGTPEQWDDYTVVRIFDRKPSPEWPRGRTIIVAGEQVIYDSPKKVGARAFDPRWPKRWHPYTRYRWEGQVGSMYGRSLVTKLLPKLKRINAIDTTQIMWRRTVPIASWIMPKGTSVVEDLHTGKPGAYIEYDPRRTMTNEPKPVYPPSYPAAALEERQTQVAEMEAIAGTEQILRGERPVGVNSAAMVDILRKQALASRSAILQAWDESLQDCGSALLQEVIKHVGEDERYKARIALLARENKSQFNVDHWSGTALSDNINIIVDTASLALVSKEAKQARAMELIKNAPMLMQLPARFRSQLVDELGWPDALQPQGADIARAKTMISYIKNNRFELAIPMAEDDPFVMHELLVAEMKKPTFVDLREEQAMKLYELIKIYETMIQRVEMQQVQFQAQMAAAGEPEGGGGG